MPGGYELSWSAQLLNAVVGVEAYARACQLSRVWPLSDIPSKAAVLLGCCVPIIQPFSWRYSRSLAIWFRL
jgi:hypothetical protein